MKNERSQFDKPKYRFVSVTNVSSESSLRSNLDLFDFNTNGSLGHGYENQ